MNPIDFHLYFITDRHKCHPRPLTDVVKEACEAGIKAVQLREKDLSPVELFHMAEEIKKICQTYRARLFINDRIDVAMGVEADGVQLTGRSLPVDVVRRFYSGLIGVSTHSLDEALLAQRGGADFALFGPIFFTPSKIQYGEPQGLSRLQYITRNVKLLVFAVGGITPDRAKACLEAGAHGVAVISAIMSSENIKASVREFQKRLPGL